MSATPAPKGYWKSQREQLAQLAPSRTLDELLKFYPHTTRKRLRQELNKAGIKCLDSRNHVLITAAQRQELLQNPLSRTPREWAERFGVPLERMHSYLARHAIKAKRGKPLGLWEQRRAWLSQHAPGQTLQELQKKIASEFQTEHNCGAIRQALLTLGIDFKRAVTVSPHRLQAERLTAMAQTMTCTQMANELQLSYKYMARLLNELGIKPQSGLRKSQAVPAKATGPDSAPRRTAKPTSKALATTPPRTSIVTRKPAQIVWPEHVKVQRVGLPIPKDTRICTGSMREPYRTGQGLGGYQSF